MCIYCGTTKYRRIYENHYGKIPNDPEGRTYDIHHIDGNHTNNNPNNLEALSLEEHIAIHEHNGDWAACYVLSLRLKLSPAEVKEYASKANLKRVKDGTHNLLGGNQQRAVQRKRVLDGTHNLLGLSNPVHEKVANGTHPWLGGEISRRTQQQRLADGTHHNLDKEKASARERKKVKEGTHPFQGKDAGEIVRNRNLSRIELGVHQSQTIRTCPHCGKIGKGGAMIQWHFDRCKNKSN